MINVGQSVTQATRRDESARRTTEVSSSSGSSFDSSSSSTVTAQGNAATQPHTQAVRPDHSSNPQTNVATSQHNSNMPSTRHITTHDPNSGIFTTRVEIRHEAIPDLLHSHVVPSQHSHGVPSQHSHGVPSQHSHGVPSQQSTQAPIVTRHGQQVRQPPPAHLLNQRGQVHVRHHPSRQIRQHQQQHRRRTRSRSHSNSEDEPCKAGCLSCLAASTSFRWILVILSLLGVCCVVTGIVLAALHAAGNSFLFLAIMFIGLGVLLVVVVAVGWKCTPRGHEPLHALFGLGDFRRRRGGRRRGRRRGHQRGDERWYGGVMYPEFQYRRPPPSYNASLQDSLHQLAMAQSAMDMEEDDIPAEDYSLPSSNPPSYRSRASTVRTGIQITFPPNREGLPNSRPPTYRSHVSTHPSRPSLPHDMDSAGGDVAFTGPDYDIANIDDVNMSRTHSRQPSASANSHSANHGEPLDHIVQQTLQTLDDATIEGQRRSNDDNDDDYPQFTAL
ncbi:uncharacterized protein [Mytilus edulis]|uniref:uncharacterized protein n=1 Tax=Mytilus edulis TaxID=6550 RepID=UPI0039F0C2F7